VQQVPLTQEEEIQIYEGHIKYGNKWAEIAQLLKGRTDNYVKNYFYSTLRRQIRKIYRYLKKAVRKERHELSIDYIRNLLKENNVPYSEIDNIPLRETIEKLDTTNANKRLEERKEEKEIKHSYSL